MMFVSDHKALRYFLTLENYTKTEKGGHRSRNDEGTIWHSTQLLKPLILLVLHQTQLQCFRVKSMSIVFTANPVTVRPCKGRTIILL